jgi:DNA polymerase/3'-5' exonuclease PolX
MADWTDSLAEEYNWTDDRGPEAVVQEARETGIDSLAEVQEALEQAPPSYSTGYAKWRYYRELQGEGN